MTTPATHVMSAWSCTVRLVVDNHQALRPATADLTELLAAVDRAGSRFRRDSALSVANSRAGRPTPIPRLLVDLVDAALRSAAQSEGAVDPTVGRMMNRAGYDRDLAEIEPTGPAILVAPQRRRWRDVRLDREVGLPTVPAGTALDLGATAKAYTADLAARSISARYGGACLVELGGDLAVGGHRAEGWTIRVAEREGGPAQLVTVYDGGLTTSTTTVRRWMRGGTLAHHILDPATGLPAVGPWRTATVHADSALAANTASTAAIVLGDAAETWLAECGHAARLVAQDGSITTLGNWPTDTELDGTAGESLDAIRVAS